jgi:hypothetical protein
VKEKKKPRKDLGFKFHPPSFLPTNISNKKTDLIFILDLKNKQI